MTAPEIALSREQIESIVHGLRQISPHALLWGLMNLSAQALAAHNLADRIAMLEAELAAKNVEIERLRADHEEACEIAAENLGHYLDERKTHAAAEAARDEAVRAERERCAQLATSFLVGDPNAGIPLRNPMAHEIAAAIRALPALPASEPPHE